MNMNQNILNVAHTIEGNLINNDICVSKVSFIL